MKYKLRESARLWASYIDIPMDSVIPSVQRLRGRPLPLIRSGLYISACCGMLLVGNLLAWQNHLTFYLLIKSSSAVAPALFLISSFLVLSLLDTLSILLRNLISVVVICLFSFSVIVTFGISITELVGRLFCKVLS